MDQNPNAKRLLQTLVLAVLFLLLFVILLPPLLTLLHETVGKVLYGILVAGAVALALRLRVLSHTL